MLIIFTLFITARLKSKPIVHSMTWQSTPCSAVIGLRCLSTRLAAWSRRRLYTERLICEIEPPYVSAHATASRCARESLCDCAKSFRERPTRASRFVSRRRVNSDKDHMRWRRRGIRRDLRVIFFLERIKSPVQSS